MGCTTSTQGGIKASSNSPPPPTATIRGEEVPVTTNVDQSIQATPETAKEKTSSQHNSSPSTAASSQSPPLSSGTTTGGGNKAIDPGMFIQPQRGTLGERYHRERKLGSGAYGEVWLCRDRQSNAERAIKFIKKSSVSPGAGGSSLLDEVEVVKSLDHPNIMKLYEFFGDKKYYYLVMECYKGGELFDEIINRQKFGEADAANILRQVLSGVTYLHRHHIVHRDLKPENLLLESKAKDAQIKIVDFGLSSHFDPSRKMMDRLGTAYYIAPEVLRKKYDEKCDVWSCGVILYILLCGYPPFGGASDQEILKRVEKGKYSFDPAEWSQISSDVKDLIRSMLEYDPAKRVSAAEALGHRWIKKWTSAGNATTDAPLLASALNNMKKFRAGQKLAQAALLFMGSKLTTMEETKELLTIFQQLDTNHDGQLDRQELITGYRELMKLKGTDISALDEVTDEMIERDVDTILDSVDFDKNGYIEYSEFVTVAMDKKVLLSKGRLRAAFNLFDVDGSGTIAADELKRILVDVDDDQWAQIIGEVDTNGDGEVDFDEFVAMMQKIGRPRSDNGTLTLVPFNVSERTCISRILEATTYNELKQVLSKFHNWVWDKGDMLVWTPVLNRLDQALLQYIQQQGLHLLPGNSLPMTTKLFDHPTTSEGTTPLSGDGPDRDCVFEILRVIQIIVDSCSAKAMFNSVGSIMLLLDSFDVEIMTKSLFILIISSYVARKSKKPVDAPWISEFLRRLHILATPPYRAVTDPHNLQDINPVSYYTCVNWKVQPTYAAIYTEASTGESIAVTNADILLKANGLTHDGSLVKFSLEYDVKEHISFRHHVRVVLNDSLEKRRGLLDSHLLAQMCIISLSPSYFQSEVAHSEYFMNELTLLTMSHREISYSTLALVTDTWLNLLSEKILVKQVMHNLQLNLPHGILFELMSTYIADRTLFPEDETLEKPQKDGSLVKLPELLFEERETSSEGSLNDRNTDNKTQKVNPDANDNEDQIAPPAVLAPIQCLVETRSNVGHEVTRAAYSSKDLYLRLSKQRSNNTLELDSKGYSADPSLLYCERVRSHAELVTALLDLYQEALFSSGSPSLCSPPILKMVGRLLELRDYRYLQVCMSALRSIEAYYDHSGMLSNAKVDLKEINLVERCARRLRYELSHISEITQNLEAEGWIVGGTTPWTSQGSIMMTRNTAGGCSDMDRAVSVYSKQGPGVPCNWIADDLRGAYFWQMMEEMASRRSLTAAIIKDGPVLLWYPYGNDQGSIALDLVEEFGVAYKYIFSHPEEVSYPVVSAAIQSLGDVRNEDPTSHRHLTTSGILETLYRSLPQLVRFESCMSFIPPLLVQICQHDAGLRDMERFNAQPLLLLIDHVASPELTYYDRVPHITASIGQSLDTLIKMKESFAQVICAKFKENLVKLEELMMSLPPWEQHTDAYQQIKSTLEADEVQLTMKLGNLSLPPTPPHQYLVDRIANVARTLQGLLHTSSPAVRRLFAHECLPTALKLSGLTETEALPPMTFTACLANHPLTDLIKSMIVYISEFNEGSNSMILTELGCLISTAQGMLRVLAELKNLTAGLDISSSMRYRQIEDAVAFRRREFIKYCSLLGNRLTFIAGSIKEKSLLTTCDSDLQLPTLLGLASALPSICRIFGELLRSLYLDFVCIPNLKECPMVLVLRASLHEPPELVAARVELRKSKNDPLTESSCFHSPLADPVSISIGRPCLGQHAYLWSTLCEYAYSMGSALLDDNVPLFPYLQSAYGELRHEEASKFVPTWSSDSLIKDLVRNVCVACRSFVSACARATTVIPKSTPTSSILAAQSLLGFELGQFSRILLQEIPTTPSPLQAMVPEKLDLDRTVRLSSYLAECWDILYRTHVDEKSSGTIIPAPLDAAVKLGFSELAVNAANFVNNIHFAVQAEVIRRLIRSPNAHLDSNACCSHWQEWHGSVAHQLQSIPLSDLESWLPLVEKAYQSTSSYCEKLTSWRRVVNSSATVQYLKPKRSRLAESDADKWFVEFGDFDAFQLLFNCLLTIAMNQYEWWNMLVSYPRRRLSANVTFQMNLLQAYGSSKSFSSVVRCIQHMYIPLADNKKEHASAWKKIHSDNAWKEGDTVEVDQSYIIEPLQAMGFSLEHAKRAVIATQGESIEAAADWAVTHPESAEAEKATQNLFIDQPMWTSSRFEQMALDDKWFTPNVSFAHTARWGLLMGVFSSDLGLDCFEKVMTALLSNNSEFNVSSITVSLPPKSPLANLEEFDEVVRKTIPSYLEGILECMAHNPAKKLVFAEAVGKCDVMLARLKEEQPDLYEKTWTDVVFESLNLCESVALDEEYGWSLGLPQCIPDALSTPRFAHNYSNFLTTEDEEVAHEQLRCLLDMENHYEESYAHMTAYVHSLHKQNPETWIAYSYKIQNLFCVALDVFLHLRSSVPNSMDFEPVYRISHNVMKIAVEHRKRYLAFLYHKLPSIGYTFLGTEGGIGVPSWTMKPEPFSPIFGLSGEEDRLGPYSNAEKTKRRQPRGVHGSAAAFTLPPLHFQAPTWLCPALLLLNHWVDHPNTSLKPDRSCVPLLMDVLSTQSGMFPADFRALIAALTPLVKICKFSSQVLSHKVFIYPGLSNSGLVELDRDDSVLSREELSFLPRGLGALLRIPKNADSAMTAQNVCQLLRYIAEDPAVIMQQAKKHIEDAFKRHGVEIDVGNGQKASVLPVGELNKLCYSVVTKSQTLFENVVSALCILRKGDFQMLLQLAPPPVADQRFKKLIDTRSTTQGWQVVTQLIQHLKLFTTLHGLTYKLPLVGQLNSNDKLRVDQVREILTVDVEAIQAILTTNYRLPPFTDSELSSDSRLLQWLGLDPPTTITDQMQKLGTSEYAKSHLLYPYCLNADSLIMCLYYLFSEIPELHAALSRTPPPQIMADASPGLSHSAITRSNSATPATVPVSSIIDPAKIRWPSSSNQGTLFRQLIRECCPALMVRALPNYSDDLWLNTKALAEKEGVTIPQYTFKPRDILTASDSLLHMVSLSSAKSQFFNAEASCLLKFSGFLLLLATHNLEIRRKLNTEVMAYVKAICATRFKRNREDQEDSSIPSEDTIVVLSFFTGILLHGLLTLPTPVAALTLGSEDETVIHQALFSPSDRAFLRPAVGKLLGRFDLKRGDTPHLAQIWAWVLSHLFSPQSLDCEMKIPSKEAVPINNHPFEDGVSLLGDGVTSQEDDDEEGIDDENMEDFLDSNDAESLEIILEDGSELNGSIAEDYPVEGWEEENDWSDGSLEGVEDGDHENLLYNTDEEDSYNENDYDDDMMGEEEEEILRVELPHEETNEMAIDATSDSFDGLASGEEDEDFDEERDEIPRLREEEIIHLDEEGLEGDENSRGVIPSDANAAEIWDGSVEWLNGVGRTTKTLASPTAWWTIEPAAKPNPYEEWWTTRVGLSTLIHHPAAVINDLWPYPNFPALLTEKAWLERPPRLSISAYDGDRWFKDASSVSDWWSKVQEKGEWFPPPVELAIPEVVEFEAHLVKKCEKNMMKMKPWSEPTVPTEVEAEKAPNESGNNVTAEMDEEIAVQSEHGNVPQNTEPNEFYDLPWSDKCAYYHVCRGSHRLSGILNSNAFRSLAFGLGLTEHQLVSLMQLDATVIDILPEDLQEEAIGGPVSQLTEAAVRELQSRNFALWKDHTAQQSEVATANPTLNPTGCVPTGGVTTDGDEVVQRAPVPSPATGATNEPPPNYHFNYRAISELWLTVLPDALRDLVHKAFAAGMSNTFSAGVTTTTLRLDSINNVMDQISSLLANLRGSTRRIEINRQPSLNLGPAGMLAMLNESVPEARLTIPASLVPGAPTEVRARLCYLEPREWRSNVTPLSECVLPIPATLVGVMKYLYLRHQVSRRALHALFHNLCSSNGETSNLIVCHILYILWQAVPDLWPPDVQCRSPDIPSMSIYPPQHMIENGDEKGSAKARTVQQTVATRALEFLQSLSYTCSQAIAASFSTPLVHPKFFDPYKSLSQQSIIKKRKVEAESLESSRPLKKTRLEEKLTESPSENTAGSTIHAIRFIVQLLNSQHVLESNYLCVCLLNTISTLLTTTENGHKNTAETQSLIDCLTDDDCRTLTDACFQKLRVSPSDAAYQQLWQALQINHNANPHTVLKQAVYRLYNSVVVQALDESMVGLLENIVEGLDRLCETLPKTPKENEALTPAKADAFTQYEMETMSTLFSKLLTTTCEVTLSDINPNFTRLPPPEATPSPSKNTSPTITPVISPDSESMKEQWHIHRVADIFSHWDNRTHIWDKLDELLRRIAEAYPELVTQRGVTEDTGLAGFEDKGANDASAPSAPAPITHRLNRRTVITPAPVEDSSINQAPPHLGILPLVVNRLIPVLEGYVFVHLVRIADELGEYHLLPSFFQSSVLEASTPSKAIKFIQIGSADEFRNHLNEEVTDEVFLSQATKLFEERVRKIVYDEVDGVSLTKTHAKLLEFCSMHSIAINGLMRQNPSLAVSSLSPLIYLAPTTMWFDNKRHYFRTKIKQLKDSVAHAPIRLTVRRSDVFVDTYNLLRRHRDNLYGKFVITFKDEPGVDAGGLTREWYSILSREIFNPNYALFQQHGCKSEFNHPNRLSYITPNHLDLFYFCGQIIAKAIYDGYYLDAYFTRPFYKLILGRKLNIPSDAESIDPVFYKNLLSLKDYDIDELDLDLRMTYETNEFGVTTTYDLVPDGHNIVVTKSNLDQYIELVCQHKILHGIEKQISNFLKGFYSIIPKYLIQIFNDKELELIISGLPEIDLQDLQNNCLYTNYRPTDREIIWLWEILNDLDRNQLANFIQFVTGTSKIPIGGFANLIGNNGPQKFHITKAYNTNNLPTSHTCFNQLDLPNYEDKQTMRIKLLQAITEGNQGFGFV